MTTPVNVWRYQYGNHLGSAALELDGSGVVISYEEYCPYGASSYRAVNSGITASAKRYRYTGKERDEETGLHYHGARYYACLLGRWTASDPIGLGDGVSRFAYVSGNPILMSDPSGQAGEIACGTNPDGTLIMCAAPETQAEAAQLQAAHGGDSLFPFSADSPVLPDPENAESLARHSERNRKSQTRSYRGGPTSGAMIEPLYAPFEGSVGPAYESQVATFTDGQAGLADRAGALAGAVLLAAPLLLEGGGEAILNAPRSAHLAVKHIERATTQEDWLNVADDLAIAAGHVAEVASAGLAVAEPIALAPKKRAVPIATAAGGERRPRFAHR